MQAVANVGYPTKGGPANVFLPTALTDPWLPEGYELKASYEQVKGKPLMRLTRQKGNKNTGSPKTARGVGQGKAFQYKDLPSYIPAFGATVFPMKRDGDSILIELPEKTEGLPEIWERLFGA